MTDATDRAKRVIATLETEKALTFSSVREVLTDCINEIERLTSEVLHWKGMTKGRESEIDKHLARNEKLEGVISRSYDLVKLGRYQMADEELRAALKEQT